MNSGKLGSIDCDTTWKLLGSATANGFVLTVRFANQTPNTVRGYLAVGTALNGSVPFTKDIINGGVAMVPFGLAEDTGVVLSNGESVWASSSVASGVSARAYGVI